ncbi:MAG: GNAT family N-acetyltransferase [Pseudomonadota bacterium]
MKIDVRPGFREADRAAIAELFLDAFGRKLAPSLGTDDRAHRFIAQGLRPEFGFSALDETGTLLGAAGIKTEKGGFLSGTYSDLRAIYGTFGAIWRGAILDQFERKLAPGVMQMDGIFVAASARGLGVGTSLLDAVVWTARMNRCREVRLEVIAENARAQALYLRYGFRRVGVVKTGLLRPVMGFREADTMALDLS